MAFGTAFKLCLRDWNISQQILCNRFNQPRLEILKRLPIFSRPNKLANSGASYSEGLFGKHEYRVTSEPDKFGRCAKYILQCVFGAASERDVAFETFKDVNHVEVRT